ncbi:cyclic pyranopterin monophosphate synthase [Rhodococcoides trifolii]|uniref:GTP 3',8-cyclase n=2 Tax=Rhodococcoides trifolii TaxID=908250 RepID=A0A917D2N5_9NOCA|nr:cyclic pyranopterin monophosphate synthase [Rhodococcus trifolii]
MGIPTLRLSTPSATDDRPDEPLLLDRFGRVARDLRISITEKCSLRCTYCMPAEGLPAIAPEKLLSAAEIARVVGIAVHRLGIQDVRFTGGEPLVRRDLVDIVARCSAAAPGVSMAMTTNAIGLDRRARSLAEAGLTRVNVSLDTVDRRHFETLTRRDRLPAVMAGIDGALAEGLSPVKINAVLMPETLHGATDLLAWCLDRGVRLRFIEQMPLDADHEWDRSSMVDAETLLDVLGRRFDLTEVGRDDPSAPAEEWEVDGGPSTVGIIASVTRSFCSDCDRTRLTAEGTVRSCLFSDTETDIRGALRGGATDEEIADLWRGAMWNKWAGHGIDAEGFEPPARSMGAIGG